MGKAIKCCLDGAMLLKLKCTNNSSEALVKLLIQSSGTKPWDPKFHISNKLSMMLMVLV